MATTTVMLTAQTSAVQISIANPRTDGSGEMGQIYSGMGKYGSVVTSIIVKAVSTTTPGMVRIFLQNPEKSKRFLVEEFSVYPTVTAQTYGGIIETYQGVLVFPTGDFKIAEGWSLYASTQNAETFNVIVDGFTQNYCDC